MKVISAHASRVVRWISGDHSARSRTQGNMARVSSEKTRSAPRVSGFGEIRQQASEVRLATSRPMATKVWRPRKGRCGACNVQSLFMPTMTGMPSAAQFLDQAIEFIE